MTDAMLLAQETKTYFQFGRAQALTEGWQWLALVGVVGAVVAYVIYMYRRDSRELPPTIGWLLTGLRILAFSGILFYFLDLEKRTQQRLVKDSRALVLVDTSQSMGLTDPDEPGAPNGQARIEGVVAAFQGGELLAGLRRKHEVIVYKFDQGSKPVEVANLSKLPAADIADGGTGEEVQSSERVLRGSQFMARVAGGIVVLSLLAGLAHLLFGTRSPGGEPKAWGLLAGVLLLVASAVVLAVANLRAPEAGFLAVLGLAEPETRAAENGFGDLVAPTEKTVAWREQLIPQGSETRLGDALAYLVNKERGGPIAGILVFTDGRTNAGVEYTAAMHAARDAQIPVFTVGLGSERRPVNVRLVDLEAPPRVYPGDEFKLTGFLQTFGFARRSVTVELRSGPLQASGALATEKQLEEQRTITLGDDGEIVTVEFNVDPTEPGEREFTLSVVPPAGDHDARDNAKSSVVEVVERKNRVLIVAGGPTREYRFLRNMLYRDRDTAVVVWLQSAVGAIAQEAEEVISDFPPEDELFEFDCVVAFDPDWDALSEEDVTLLERFVADKAGGLIVVAGPVNTPEWTRYRRGHDPKIDTIKALYPVIFYTQQSANTNVGRVGGEKAWPLEFTRDGTQADFLWLADDATASAEAWSSFEGVYGYYAVKDPKPGAAVYARFSDPETALEGTQPVYMAGQFYGAGRTFFQASGEIWRLRSVDEGYFETYYTKLIRWASAGRLLRDSTRGVLLTDKDRCRLGENVVVRAILQDSQHQPLLEPAVAAILIQPDGVRKTLQLKQVRDATREGTYSSDFPALQEGNYRIELSPPGNSAEELLAREVRVVAARTETERPERNDPALKEIADQTGGRYYVGIENAVRRGGDGIPALVGRLEPHDQVTHLMGSPDKQFDQRLMTWLMVLISGTLCLEWLIRRLSRLA